jgi:hypothetical protein
VLCQQVDLAYLATQGAIDCKHANATVCFIITKTVEAFVRATADNGEAAQSGTTTAIHGLECFERIAQLLQKLKRRKLPSVMANVEWAMRYILSSLHLPCPNNDEKQSSSVENVATKSIEASSHLNAEWLDSSIVQSKEVFSTWTNVLANLKGNADASKCSSSYNKSSLRRKTVAAAEEPSGSKIARADGRTYAATTWL